MKRTLILLATSLSILLDACAPSVVYDPSLQISHKPLARGDVQGVIGAAYLLETRPDSTRNQGDAGATMMLRGAFSPTVTVGLKHWVTFSSFEQNGTYRSGLSAEAHIRLSSETDRTRYSLMPRAAMLLGEGGNNVGVEGGGISLQGIAVHSLSDAFGMYGGFGPVFGFRNLSASANPSGQWGAGAIANLGASFTPTDALALGVEISGVGYYNANTEEGAAGVSPAVFVCYTF